MDLRVSDTSLWNMVIQDMRIWAEEYSAENNIFEVILKGLSFLEAKCGEKRNLQGWRACRHVSLTETQ
jgi:hypothetical protein